MKTKNYFYGKNILVTGGTGMIGRPLVKILLEKKAKVTVVSLDKHKLHSDSIKFINADLRDFNQCLKISKNMDIVFQLAGVKGSPAMTSLRPASFFVPTMMMSINMMEAARRNNVKRYLYTSSVGVYSPADLFKEDDVWKTFPSPNDRFAGWAKRMGELQAESYKIEYNMKNISIIRPANVYGEYDNFDEENAMVIPSLIKKAFSNKKKLIVWGDGSPKRDFVHAIDVARSMIFVVEQNINEPLNIGSGEGVSIKKIVKLILKYLPFKLEVEWDKNKPSGDKIRIMDTTKLSSYGFKNIISIENGIKETINWYEKNCKNTNNRFNPFKEKVMMPK